jgi:hypothetical protein
MHAENTPSMMSIYLITLINYDIYHSLTVTGTKHAVMEISTRTFFYYLS